MELVWPRFDHSWEARADLIRIYQTVSEDEFSEVRMQHSRLLSEGGENAMIGMNDMVGRCMDAMGPMMGSGVVLVVFLLVLLLVWLVGLGAVGALIVWAVRRFSRPYA
jgi:uncharacterized membrane protein